MSKTRIPGLIYRALLAIAVLLTAMGLLLYTDTVLETGKRAVLMCMEVILPSLFPFFVVSNLIIGLGFADAASRIFEPVMRRLFHVGGACAPAFVLGVIGGYPVGAKTAISLYEKKMCSRVEAERLLAFCNNSGPAFIFGVVGAGIFSNGRAGLLLYAAHIAASITVGLLYRSYRGKKEDRTDARTRVRPAAPAKAPTLSAGTVFSQSVTGALQSVISISAFVIFFAVGVNMLFTAGIMTAISERLGSLLSFAGLDAAQISGLLTGLLEVTSGLWSLSSIGHSFNSRMAMAAFMLGWAGISVHCQVLSFIGASGLSLVPYLTGKFLHAVISAAYVTILTALLPFSASASAILGEQVSALAYIDFSTALTGGILSAAAAAVGLCVPVIFFTKFKKPL